MNKSIKQIVLAAIIFSITIGVPTQVQAKEKNSYWLTGVSKEADGQLQMYYQKDSILLKGKAKKSESKDQLEDTKLKKIQDTLKVANTCKVVFIEADETTTCAYQDWVKDSRDYKEGDRISFISASIKVKNKKIVKIIFSA